MSVRSSRPYGTAVLSAVLVSALGACTSGETPTAPSTQPSETESSTPESVTPSITRDLPPEQRQSLAEVPQDGLCRLVSADELTRLGMQVEAGAPRQIGFDPPSRGCTYEARTGVRSVLIGVQPAGFGGLGRTEVALGPVRGTQTLHVNDCTVFAEVAGATLQVTVRAGEADSDQCDTAQAIAQYVLPAVRH